MFDIDPRDLAATLSQMETQARQKANFDQNEAKQKMAEWLANDRRFDSYDPARLIERVQVCKSNGAHLDLEDPQLMKGGQPRPLDRSRW
jgi:hypothetical protein